jgi:calcineurin-like phosphoesterase family protein
MKIYSNNDIVYTLTELKAQTIGNNMEINIPKNQEGTIVYVYKNGLQETVAYEVEFYISKEDEFALATIDAKDINLKH